MTNETHAETTKPEKPAFHLVDAEALPPSDPHRSWVAAVHEGLRPLADGDAYLLDQEALPMSDVVGARGAGKAAALDTWLALVNPCEELASMISSRCEESFGAPNAKRRSRRKALSEFAEELATRAGEPAVTSLVTGRGRTGHILTLTSASDSAPGMSWISELHVVRASVHWVALLQGGDYQDDPHEAFPSIIGFARAECWQRGVLELLGAADWELGGGGDVDGDDSAMFALMKEAWTGGSDAVSWMLEQPEPMWKRLAELDSSFFDADGVREALLEPPRPPAPPDLRPTIVNRFSEARNVDGAVLKLVLHYGDKTTGWAHLELMRRWSLGHAVSVTYQDQGEQLPGMQCRYELEPVTQEEVESILRMVTPDQHAVSPASVAG